MGVSLEGWELGLFLGWWGLILAAFEGGWVDVEGGWILHKLLILHRLVLEWEDGSIWVGVRSSFELRRRGAHSERPPAQYEERISSVSSTLYKTFWAAASALSGRTTLGGEGRESFFVRTWSVWLEKTEWSGETLRCDNLGEIKPGGGEDADILRNSSRSPTMERISFLVGKLWSWIKVKSRLFRSKMFAFLLK